MYGCKIRKPTCPQSLQQRAYASNAPFLSHSPYRFPSRSGDDPPVLQPILAREGPSHLHRHLDTCEEFGQVRHGVQAAVDFATETPSRSRSRSWKCREEWSSREKCWSQGCGERAGFVRRRAGRRVLGVWRADGSESRKHEVLMLILDMRLILCSDLAPFALHRSTNKYAVVWISSLARFRI